MRNSRLCSVALFLLLTESSCIIPDKCIIVTSKGFAWRAKVFGKALRPDNGQEVLLEGMADGCYTQAEHEILTANDPMDTLNVALRDELIADAALNCAQQADGLLDVQCDPDDFNLTTLVEDTGVMCVLSTLDPQGQDDPKCAGATAGQSSEPSPPDFDLAITCAGDTCYVPQALIDAALFSPSILLAEPTRLREKTVKGEVVGMYFTGVSEGSLAERLGFLSGDIVTHVDGLPLKTEADVITIAQTIVDEPMVTVTTQRDGKVKQRLFVRQ